MELNYLVYFRTVAQTEHISQAAAELHITQPALSRAISRVEQEVGAQLFERGANSIRLNHAGRAFLRRVEQILTEYDDALREAEDYSNVETGSVKLIAPTLELLTGFLRSYLPRHPDMQIFHQLAGTRDTMHELETHGADFALCPEPSGNPRIEWHPMFREQYCLAVSGGASPGPGDPGASSRICPGSGLCSTTAAPALLRCFSGFLLPGGV